MSRKLVSRMTAKTGFKPFDFKLLSQASINGFLLLDLHLACTRFRCAGLLVTPTYLISPLVGSASEYTIGTGLLIVLNCVVPACFNNLNFDHRMRAAS